MMKKTTDETYLKDVLASQHFQNDSEEMKKLREKRDEVEDILKEVFPTSTIRYGGSKAKGTLIKASYDLDLVCYFPHDESEAGNTLKELYENVSGELSEHFLVEQKTSALRLLNTAPETRGTYTHIDVVPGRYTDSTNSDCYLYQKGGDKERLKTNLKIHIAHIKDSGVIDALKLLKLWRVQNSLEVKQFVFELLGVKLLAEKKQGNLPEQLKYFFQTISESQDPIGVEDPANPSGNDLMPLLTNTWSYLNSIATRTLQDIENSGWQTVFGDVEGLESSNVEEKLAAAVHIVQQNHRTRPWSE